MGDPATAHWQYLFAIAYRMLGSVHEAEDAVQEAYARWEAAAPKDVANPRAFLATTVTRIAIDRLRSASARRETYVGPWLPEPLITDDADPAEAAADADSLSTAFLVVLESLSPVERAVFLLREVFGYEHREIAGIVERSEANVRQIAHRARESVAARRPRFVVPPERRRQIGEAFLEAMRAGSIEGMMALLDDDVTLQSDGGGQVRAARKPVHGPETVVRFLMNIAAGIPGLSLDEAPINGAAGLIARSNGEPIAAITFESTPDAIRSIFIVVAPEKLESIRKEGRP